MPVRVRVPYIIRLQELQYEYRTRTSGSDYYRGGRHTYSSASEQSQSRSRPRLYWYEYAYELRVRVRIPLFLIAASLSTVLRMVLTWMPWIRFLCGRTCILLWILYGNMVDFSFIVSLYVSDLPNVTISTHTSTRNTRCLDGPPAGPRHTTRTVRYSRGRVISARGDELLLAGQPGEVPYRYRTRRLGLASRAGEQHCSSRGEGQAPKPDRLAGGREQARPRPE